MSPDRRAVAAIFIGGRRIAADMPPFVIAGIGTHHLDDLSGALSLVDAAAAAGAHAIALHTIAQAPLDETAHCAIAKRAWSLGVCVMSTPSSLAAVSFLERVGIDAYRIDSGDLTHDQLITRCAATGKPVVLSTGLSSLAGARHAVAVARFAGAREVALLHGVPADPVPRGSENLLAIRALAEECLVPVGLSDYAEDTFALPMAVALGASIYERPLSYESSEERTEGAVSSTPAELAAAIGAARRAWAALRTIPGMGSRSPFPESSGVAGV